ncbi:MAG TPA: hypothetical protein VFG63_07965 [Nocardioidaceae bacterium]|nr:hypothetical protein [Nocardioidaceae bacterium]
MRMLLGAVAMAGALAVGGVPATVLTVGHADDGGATPAARGSPDKPQDKLADGKPGYGPPPWAQSWQHADAPGPDREKAGEEKAPQAKERGPKAKQQGPKVKKRGPKGAQSGNAHGRKMSALGRAHGEAMRTWARCAAANVGDPASEEAPDEALDEASRRALRRACGEKPTPPGHLKHPERQR